LRSDDKTIRIGFFVKAFPLTSQKFVETQIEGVIQEGFHTTIIAEQKSDLPKFKGVQLVVLNTAAKSYFTRFLFFIKLYFTQSQFRGVANKSSKYKKRGFAKLWFVNEYLGLSGGTSVDILHVMFTSYLPRVNYLIKIGLLNPGKIVVSCRGYDVTSHLKRSGISLGEFRAGVSKFLPVSESLKKVLLDNGILESEVEVVYSGLNIEKINFKEEYKLQENRNPIRLLSIGRLTEKKGHDISIRLVCGLVLRGYDIHLDIIGSGEELENLKSLAHELGVKERINFLGQKNWESTLTTLSKTSIFILMSKAARNSDQEGIPNVLKEAMALGIPCLSTFHGGIPELKPLVQFDLLCEENNAEAAVELVENLLRRKAHEIETIRLNSREFIIDNFDCREVNRKLIKIYQEVINEG